MSNTKRYLSFLLALALLLSAAVPAYAAGVVDSGTCGENLTWTLDDSGTLTISGAGSMGDFSNGVPWADHTSGITAVVLENGVTSISESAFNTCTNMRSVSLPDSLVRIGQYAFSECTSLTEITIPAGVTFIESGAFHWCDRLTMIKVDSGNPNYTGDASGALYNKTKTKLIRVPGGKTGTFVVPSGVTDIDSWALHYCEQLTNVELADTVTTIGSCAFLSCSNLKEITIPASVTSIKDLAFGSCQKLSQISFEGNAPSIASNAFYIVAAVAYYPENDATWTDKVKQNYMGSINWVAKKAYIDQGTCGENLTWTLDAKGNLTISGTGDMEEFVYGAPWCDNAYNITAVVMENGVTGISEGAFSTCTNMRSVSIPNSVTSIGQYAFAECSSLTEITIPAGVTSIGYGTFRDCGQLSQVGLPDTVTSIGNSAFHSCVNLQEITVPAGVTAIGEFAFGNCRNLKQMNFEGDAPKIATNAFAGVNATAWYPGNNASWTNDVKQNYGGTITWKAEGVEVTLPTLTLKYPTLSFESEVFYNIYFTVADAEVKVEDLGLLTWYTRPANTAAATYETAEAIIPGAVYNAGADVYMVRSEGVPAKQLGDNLYMRVYAKLSDGTYAYSAVTYYNAKFYANGIFANSQSESMKALCVAMLNYGAAAQVHFNHNADNLMNAGLTAEQKAMVKEFSSDMIGAVISADANKVGTFKSNGGFSGGYPSVSFEGAFSINYYLTPKQAVEGDITLYCWDLNTYNSVDTLTEENATTKVTMVPATNPAQYFANYAGIAAKQIDETVFVAGVYTSNGTRYSSPVISYSLGAYCADQIANGTATMQEFAKATAVYGNYAKAYFVSLNS